MALIKSVSGVRGTLGGQVGDSLSPMDIVSMTLAFGQYLSQNHDEVSIVIGRDARTSGKMISNLVLGSLQSMGVKVIDLGLTTTPTLSVAIPSEQADGGIVITASHNPNNWNALKLLNNQGESLTVEANSKVFKLAEQKNFEFVKVEKIGQVIEKTTAIDEHIDKICTLDIVDIPAIENRNFKIVVDCINSTGALIIPQLLKRLGVKSVKILYDAVNGNFSHNPEPLTENLQTLTSEIENGQYDLGFAVDPDVDRLVVICEDGTPFNEEYTLVAVADYVLGKIKGNTVSNLSSTQALKELTENYGTNYYASKVGEANVVEMMKKHDAVIGGEGNGGIIYPPLHYGRDALIGIALFLSHLANFDSSTKKLRNKYPNYIIVKNKIDIPANMDIDKFLDFMAIKYKSYPINREDGMRIDFDQQWIHIRKSNTEPIIRIYSEASSVSVGRNLCAKALSDIKEYVSK